jgi:hypothetical protein
MKSELISELGILSKRSLKERKNLNQIIVSNINEQDK